MLVVLLLVEAVTLSANGETLSPAFLSVEIGCSVLHMVAVSMFLLFLMPSAHGLLPIAVFFYHPQLYLFPFLPSLTLQPPLKCSFSSSLGVIAYSSSMICKYFDFAAVPVFLCFAFKICSWPTLEFWTVVAAGLVALMLCIMLSYLCELYTS